MNPIRASTIDAPTTSVNLLCIVNEMTLQCSTDIVFPGSY
jgi:hypothetical protein